MAPKPYFHDDFPSNYEILSPFQVLGDGTPKTPWNAKSKGELLSCSLGPLEAGLVTGCPGWPESVPPPASVDSIAESNLRWKNNHGTYTLRLFVDDSLAYTWWFCSARLPEANLSEWSNSYVDFGIQNQTTKPKLTWGRAESTSLSNDHHFHQRYC